MIKKRPATVLEGSLPVTATGEPDAGVWITPAVSNKKTD